MQLLGLAETATEDDAVAAIQRLQNENSTLTLARVTDAVDAAVADKRITADKKEHFIALGRNVGIDSLRETLSMFTPASKPTDIIHEQGGGKMARAWDKCTPEQIADCVPTTAPSTSDCTRSTTVSSRNSINNTQLIHNLNEKDSIFCP